MIRKKILLGLIFLGFISIASAGQVWDNQEFLGTATFQKKITANADIASTGTITGANFVGSGAGLTGLSYTETDPEFSGWDKSTGISITESQISDLQSYLTSETDPIYGASQASSITNAGSGEVIKSTERAKLAIAVDKTGDTMTGNLTVPNLTATYGVIGSTLTIKQISATNSDGLKLYDDGGNGIFVKDGGAIGIGTTDLPSAYAKLALHGTDSNSAGPHIQITTSANAYPLFFMQPWTHDNIYMGFDCYYNGAWRSSDDGSNFRIRKLSDKFFISSAFGITASNDISTNWRENIGISATQTVINEDGADTDFRVEGDNNANLLFCDAGNDRVGIGTSSPAETLSVNGNIQMGIAANSYKQFKIGGGNSFGYLYGAYTTLGDGINIGYNYYNDNTTDYIYNASGSTSRMKFGYGYVSIYTGTTNTNPTNLGYYQNNLGNVGIGTTTPAYKLDVAGDMRSTGTITAASFVGSGTGLTGLVVKTGDTMTGGLTITTSGSTSLSVSSTTLLATASGNVGIGTTSPKTSVQIANSTKDALTDVGKMDNYLLALTRIDATNDKGVGIAFAATTDDYLSNNIGSSIIYKRIGNNLRGELQFYTKTSTTDGAAPTQKMVIDADGNVGIGTISPNSKLDVDGSIYPHTDDTYYLGKNDDDTPYAWKGLILKDTTNSKYYRIEVINGVITATDLTD